MPWFEVTLRDPTGNPEGARERGEIVVHAHRQDALFAGYFRDPAATAQACATAPSGPAISVGSIPTAT